MLRSLPLPYTRNFEFSLWPSGVVLVNPSPGPVSTFTETGFFAVALSVTTVSAFPEVYYVNRWRLEKQDPAAEISEPKQPIVYWLDRNIP